MKNVSASNVTRVSRKPLRWIHVTSSDAGHVVEVMFRNLCNAYGLFSNTTRRSSSLFYMWEIMLLSKNSNGVVRLIFFQDEVEQFTEYLSQMIARPYLKTPRARVIQATRKLARKRKEFLSAIKRGLIPPDDEATPENYLRYVDVPFSKLFKKVYRLYC